MTFTDWVERHRRSLLTVAFALALAGVFAAITLPVGLFPVTSFPRIRIEVSTSAMPPKQMLIDVTEPLERVARAVPGAEDVSSTTSRGSAQIYVDFPWGYDMKEALLAVDAAFAQELPSLPKGTTYIVIQMSPDILMPFVSYSLTSNKVSYAALRRLAKYQIVPLLTGIPGIRRVGVLGGNTPEVQVTVNPGELSAYGLTLAQVSRALAQTNVIRAVGRLQDNDLLYLAISDNAFTSIDSVRNVALRVGRAGVVRLGDIAKVSMGAVPRWLIVDDNGHPGVNINVYQQSSADSLKLADEVKQKLAAFMKTQPRSIHLDKWYDQTQLVRSSVAALEEAILIGLVFAAMVLFAFLRSWRVTLVAMIVVPLSVLITVLLLSLLGMTFNIMTLGGIAAAIGLLIDDVIVMVEHIARRAGLPHIVNPHATVLEAAKQFFGPLLGSSLATTIIFIPLAFLSGVTGAFFKFLSLTVASALIISLLLTAFTVPLLARSLIDFRTFKDPAHGRETWFVRAHGRLLGRLFDRPLWLLPGVAVLLLIGIFAYAHVGTGFMPRMDEGGFVLNYHTKPGTSLIESNRELLEIEAILKSDPYVVSFSRRTGAGLGGDLNATYEGDFFVRLISPAKRPDIWAVMEEISRKITAQVPGVHFDTAQLMSDMIGDLVGRPQPVVVTLTAKNPAVLPAVAKRVAAAIAQVPDIQPTSVNSGVRPAGDALEIRVNRAAAAMEGVTAQEVASQLHHYLYGAVVTRYLGAVRPVGVRLWLDPPRKRIYRDELGNLPIRSPTGRIMRLATVARVRFVAGQPELTRNNLAQIVPVTARISGGHSLGGAITEVKKVLARPGLIPPGVYYSLGGQYKQEQAAVHGMIRVFAAALVAEFILLLFLYERFSLPVIVIASSVFSTGAVFIGLWLTGVELNITAMMGMVMIVGISTEMAIFLISEYQELERTMSAREAIHQAARNRLRPITMSTLAMILALLPLGAAISGSGDQMLQPLAIAIIAGALLELPLVLLAMPVIIGLTTHRAAVPARD